MLFAHSTPIQNYAPRSAQYLWTSRWCRQGVSRVRGHKLERGAKDKLIEDIAAVIWQIADALLVMDAAGNGLAISDLDDYLDGIRRFNAAQLDASSRVRVLLTNVTAPPVPILECPSDDQLAWHAVPFRFVDLFGRWCGIHILLARKLVNRYATAPGEDPLVVAFEINNEPDYEWLPDEHRIERSKSPDTMPAYKYITELHQPQIPDRYPPVVYAEKTLWGGYQEQSGNWKSDDGAHIPVLDFPWGPKFDWYVSRYAEWAKHVSFAFFDEGQRLGRRFEVVAAGVTHNNLDYLIRMHRADPGAFLYCSVIAFHPYHWPEHNIHDMSFRDRRDYTDWRQQSPRSFAAYYFKCFDFFKQFNEFIVDAHGLWAGFKGKRIWLTEFGIGTKLHGEYNSVNAQFVPFIRPASMPADSLPAKSVVWEELWRAFLTTITPEYLHELNVEAMFFYALREVGVPGLDKHDDDRTNFAIMHRYGQPRLDRSVFDRLSGFIRGMTGRAADPALVSFPLVPDWARWRDFSLPLLKSEPWRYVAVPTLVMDTMSMTGVGSRMHRGSISLAAASRHWHRDQQAGSAAG